MIDIVPRCWICRQPITAGWSCDDCTQRMTIPADDVIVETYDDPDGWEQELYRREKKEHEEDERIAV